MRSGRDSALAWDTEKKQAMTRKKQIRKRMSLGIGFCWNMDIQPDFAGFLGAKSRARVQPDSY
jgi:hypothetical protein